MLRSKDGFLLSREEAIEIYNVLTRIFTKGKNDQEIFEIINTYHKLTQLVLEMFLEERDAKLK